jgi:hypothetical protein
MLPQQVHDELLLSFERCRELGALRQSVDLVDALLDTSNLEASNPNDYQYGLLGMADVPARPITFSEWLSSSQRGEFLPIDYSADLESVLATVTFYVLMQAGLGVLIRFKFFSPSSQRNKSQVPSWVIDWRQAARVMKRT